MALLALGLFIAAVTPCSRAAGAVAARRDSGRGHRVGRPLVSLAVTGRRGSLYRRCGRLPTASLPATPAGKPDGHPGQDDDGRPRMDGEDAGQRRPAPVGRVRRRIPHVDDEQLGDAPDDQERADDEAYRAQGPARAAGTGHGVMLGAPDAAVADAVTGVAVAVVASGDLLPVFRASSTTWPSSAGESHSGECPSV